MANRKLHPAVRVVQAMQAVKHDVPVLVLRALHAAALDSAELLAGQRNTKLGDVIAALYEAAADMEPMLPRVAKTDLAKVREGQVGT